MYYNLIPYCIQGVVKKSKSCPNYETGQISGISLSVGGKCIDYSVEIVSDGSPLILISDDIICWKSKFLKKLNEKLGLRIN